MAARRRIAAVQSSSAIEETGPMNHEAQTDKQPQPVGWRFLLLVSLLLLAIGGLQYRLWFAEGGIRHTAELEKKLASQSQANSVLQQRNDKLRAEVKSLQSGHHQIEAYAREELGLVKDDETWFRFVDAPAGASAATRPEKK